MAREDQSVREELAADGSLFQGYHPRMEAVHRRNAARLRELVAAHGWPGEAVAGADGAEAAWLVAMHAIGEPAFLRACLQMMEASAARGDIPKWHVAMLEDRIRMYEGRPQRYGTQLEPGDGGEARPYIIEEPDGVDERRRAVGLEPLAERLARAGTLERPSDPERHERDYREWLVRTGWRTS